VTAPRPKAAPAPATSPTPELIGASEPTPTDTSDFAAVQSLDPRSADVAAAQSASQGVVVPAQLLAPPVYRSGELLEAMPGLIVTQHSGEGKANQYFLRGFNLDHGTDLGITIDGMPVNMRTHGHGQGYGDTNFMIPEIMRGLAYRKGPYFASDGDFASAGSIYLDVADKLEKNFAQVEVGGFGHRRAVGGMSAPVGLAGTVLVAGEIVNFDGPWERLTMCAGSTALCEIPTAPMTMALRSPRWRMAATGSQPTRFPCAPRAHRSLWQHRSDRWGFAHRYSLSGRWHETTAEAATRVNAYVIRSDLSLFINFTYFLNDPVNGDQFRQKDDRLIAGGSASKTYFGTMFGGTKSETTFGVQSRYDSIDVGLFNTKQRVGPGPRPSFISTPARAFIATMLAAPSPRSIRSRRSLPFRS
jgi:TonB-dependent Receptor Plug Domain